MSPPPALAGALIEQRVASRIWNRETSVFAPQNAALDRHAAIASRLGWLDAPAEDAQPIAALLAFAQDIRQAGLTDVYLLGMGGSSLCAEVLRDVPGATTGDRCRLVVLDTTDERAITDVTDRLQPERSLFLVASKSGSTIEVTSLERHFWAVMSAAVGDGAGRQFVATTDPGTALAAHAKARGYRYTFLAPADVGGRYSALTRFGLVPAALLGLNLAALLTSARRMADDCRADSTANPGVALGAFMADQAGRGRDKLTVLLPAPLAALGPWIEQLVAESTGKDGRGILPIVGEPLDEPDQYGPDRAFVAVLTAQSVDVAATALSVERAGHPVFRIQTTSDKLGAELFRWEFATAVAGAALRVNPFDEPDVRSGKARTHAQLDVFRTTGALRTDPPLSRTGSYWRRESRPREAASPRGRYVAILDYRPPDLVRRPVVDRIRRDIHRLTRMPTTHGIGPRYLHSTGQYHKGGPSTGLFLLVTASDLSQTPVPGTGYTFSVLKRAQALGDFEALVAAGRHVVHYHFDDPEADISSHLIKVASETR